MLKAMFSTVTFLATIPVSAMAEQTVPPALQMMIDSNAAELVERFDTPSPTIKGYVIEQSSGDHVIIYGVDGHAMAGVLVDEEGKNLTKRYAAKYIPEPDFSHAGEKVAQSEYLVSEGAEDAPEIYVFSDPNCPYCKRFYESTRELVENGDVRIHWVMVAFLHETSERISSAIMEGGMEVMDQAKTSSRADAPKADSLPEAHAKALAEHNQLMQQAEISGTPGLLYEKDGRWETKSGAPSPQKFRELVQSL